MEGAISLLAFGVGLVLSHLLSGCFFLTEHKPPPSEYDGLVDQVQEIHGETDEWARMWKEAGKQRRVGGRSDSVDNDRKGGTASARTLTPKQSQATPTPQQLPETRHQANRPYHRGRPIGRTIDQQVPAPVYLFSVESQHMSFANHKPSEKDVPQPVDQLPPVEQPCPIEQPPQRQPQEDPQVSSKNKNKTKQRGSFKTKYQHERKRNRELLRRNRDLQRIAKTLSSLATKLEGKVSLLEQQRDEAQAEARADVDKPAFFAAKRQLEAMYVGLHAFGLGFIAENAASMGERRLLQKASDEPLILLKAEDVPDKFLNKDGEPMKDPVLASDGHVYERKDFEHWVKQEKDEGNDVKSWYTREVLKSLDVKPVPAARQVLEQCKKSQKDIQQLRESNERAKAAMQRRQDQLREAEEQMKESDEKLNHFKEQLAASELKAKELTESNERVKAEVEFREDQLRASQKKLNETDANLKRAKEQFAVLELKAKELTVSNERVKAAIKCRENHLRASEVELYQKHEELKLVKEQFAALGLKVKELTESNERASKSPELFVRWKHFITWTPSKQNKGPVSPHQDFSEDISGNASKDVSEDFSDQFSDFVPACCEDDSEVLVSDDFAEDVSEVVEPAFSEWKRLPLMDGQELILDFLASIDFVHESIVASKNKWSTKYMLKYLFEGVVDATQNLTGDILDRYQSYISANHENFSILHPKYADMVKMFRVREQASAQLVMVHDHSWFNDYYFPKLGSWYEKLCSEKQLPNLSAISVLGARMFPHEPQQYVFTILAASAFQRHRYSVSSVQHYFDSQKRTSFPPLSISAENVVDHRQELMIDRRFTLFKYQFDTDLFGVHGRRRFRLLEKSNLQDFTMHGESDFQAFLKNGFYAQCHGLKSMVHESCKPLTKADYLYTLGFNIVNSMTDGIKTSSQYFAFSSCATKRASVVTGCVKHRLHYRVVQHLVDELSFYSSGFPIFVPWNGDDFQWSGWCPILFMVFDWCQRIGLDPMQLYNDLSTVSVNAFLAWASIDPPQWADATFYNTIFRNNYPHSIRMHSWLQRAIRLQRNHPVVYQRRSRYALSITEVPFISYSLDLASFTLAIEKSHEEFVVIVKLIHNVWIFIKFIFSKLQ